MKLFGRSGDVEVGGRDAEILMTMEPYRVEVIPRTGGLKSPPEHDESRSREAKSRSALHDAGRVRESYVPEADRCGMLGGVCWAG